jgi:hypothetical protein
MPTNKTYTITFRTGAYPIALEMLKGIDNVRPTQTIRYVDLSLPANVTAMLKITPQGVENLRYDKDGDVVFETEVTPTVSVTGAMAQDQTPPVIAFSEKAQGDNRLLTITAIDAGAGVKAVHYSLDGAHFYLYTEPLKIKLEDDRRSVVYAFADDGVANRSSFVKYKPLVPSVAAVRDAMSGEIIVNLTLVNNSTAAVVSNISLNSLRLNGKPTTTTLPQTVGTLAPGEVVTRSVRFPASAVKSTRAELSGTGTENGGEFGGNITITVPIP